MGLMLAMLFAIGTVAFLIGLGFYSDRKREEERQWFHETMERIAEKEEKGEMKEKR